MDLTELKVPRFRKAELSVNLFPKDSLNPGFEHSPNFLMELFSKKFLGGSSLTQKDVYEIYVQRQFSRPD